MFSIIHTNISCSGSIMYLIIHSLLLMLLPFAHPSSALGFFSLPSSAAPDMNRAEERHEQTCARPAAKSPLSDATVGMFLWVTSLLLQAGTHTLLALLLMHQQPNLSLEALTLIPEAPYLPNSEPIDSEEFISMVVTPPSPSP